jgi:hypothetical protein
MTWAITWNSAPDTADGTFHDQPTASAAAGGLGDMGVFVTLRTRLRLTS